MSGVGGAGLAAARRRLLMVTTADLGGQNGPAVHFLGLATQFSAMGLDVTVVARPTGVNVPAMSALGRRWIKAGFVPALMRALRRAERPDAILLRAGLGTYPLARMARKRWPDVPLLIDANSWFHADLELLGHRRLIVRLGLLSQVWEARLASHVRVVTQTLADRYTGAGIPTEKIIVIGNGADLVTFQPLDRTQCRSALGLDPVRPTLAMVSNLWPAIDLATTFRAIMLLGQRGRAIDLVVGGSGISRGVFEADARDVFGADPPVRWLGGIDHGQANQLLNAADAVLAPFVAQRNAATGLAPLKVREAAAAGRACVATDLPGMTELGREPWMFLAAPGDPEAMADAIERALAADPETVRHSARDYAERNFAWADIAAAIAARLFPEARSTAAAVPASIR